MSGRGVLSLVSRENHFCQVHEGLSLGGRPQLADLARGGVAVALGEVGRLLHTITLQHILPCPFNISWLTESPHYHSIHFWKLSTKGEGFVLAFELFSM